MAVAKCPKCRRNLKVKFYRKGWNIIRCPEHGDFPFQADTREREKVLEKKKNSHRSF